MAKASDNLIPQAHVLTLEEQSAGGKASGEARRKKATMLQTLEQCLEETNKKSGKTYRELATLGLIKGARQGYSKNYEIIQDLMEKKEAKDDEIMVLHTLTVNPSNSHKGIGKKFVKFYENYAKDNNCTELRLDTNEINSVARAFYKKLGYNEIGIVPTVFNGIPNVVALIISQFLFKH